MTDPVDEPGQLVLDVLRRPQRRPVQRLGQIEVRATLQVAQVLQPLGDRRDTSPLARSPPPTGTGSTTPPPTQPRPAPRRPSESPPTPPRPRRAPRRPSPGRPVSVDDSPRRVEGAAGGTPQRHTRRRRPPTPPRRRRTGRVPCRSCVDPVTVAGRVGHPDPGVRGVACRRGPGPRRSRGSAADLAAAAGPATPPWRPAPAGHRRAGTARTGVDLRFVALEQRGHDLADPPQPVVRVHRRSARPRRTPCRPCAGRSPAACRASPIRSTSCSRPASAEMPWTVHIVPARCPAARIAGRRLHRLGPHRSRSRRPGSATWRHQSRRCDPPATSTSPAAGPASPASTGAPGRPCPARSRSPPSPSASSPDRRAARPAAPSSCPEPCTPVNATDSRAAGTTVLQEVAEPGRHRAGLDQLVDRGAQHPVDTDEDRRPRRPRRSPGRGTARRGDSCTSTNGDSKLNGRW